MNSNTKYKGFWIVANPALRRYRITKDGFHISLALSEKNAKNTIDLLVKGTSGVGNDSCLQEKQVKL